MVGGGELAGDGMSRLLRAVMTGALVGAVTAPAPGLAAGIWISRAEIAALPMSGPAWESLLAEANRPIGMPNLADAEDSTNVAVLAKALVHARTAEPSYRDEVIAACMAAIATEGTSTLALGRELAAYVIAADLVGLPAAQDGAFRAWLSSVRHETIDGRTLVSTHEDRPNNWGTHAGASRIAAALYLGDTIDLERGATVFRGWLGDRAAYAGFEYDSLSWQEHPSRPVGINAKAAVKNGHSIDGVLPDDQRRGGAFVWPPPHENYVYEALQGALAQAVMLHRAGYPVWEWQDRALLRAFEWLHREAQYAAEGDDTWQPHVVNHYYWSDFPAPTPSRAGKNVGWTDWTHAGHATGGPPDDGGEPGGGGDGDSLCGAVPRVSGCASAELAEFTLANTRDGDAAKLRWKWFGRPGLGRTAWGNPLVSSAYELCAYDSVDGTGVLGFSFGLPAGAGWSSASTARLRYRVHDRLGDGVVTADLRTTNGPGERVRMRAQAATLRRPAGSVFRQSPEVTVELVTSDGSCWSSRFAMVQTLRNEPGDFHAVFP